MNTTPSPTAEEIAADELSVWDESGKLSVHRAADRVVAALRTHNLLSEGAPSEDQIERAWAVLNAHGLAKHIRTNGKRERDVVSEMLTAAGVAPQGEVQESPENELSPERSSILDPEKVAEVLRRADWADEMWDDMPQRDRDRNWELYLSAARALCEAYTEGKLT